MPSLKFLIGTSQSFTEWVCSSDAQLWKTVNCLNLSLQVRLELFIEVVSRARASVTASKHFLASDRKIVYNQPIITTPPCKKHKPVKSWSC